MTFFSFVVFSLILIFSSAFNVVHAFSLYSIEFFHVFILIDKKQSRKGKCEYVHLILSIDCETAQKNSNYISKSYWIQFLWTRRNCAQPSESELFSICFIIQAKQKYVYCSNSNNWYGAGKRTFFGRCGITSLLKKKHFQIWSRARKKPLFFFLSKNEFILSILHFFIISMLLAYFFFLFLKKIHRSRNKSSYTHSLCWMKTLRGSYSFSDMFSRFSLCLHSLEISCSQEWKRKIFALKALELASMRTSSSIHIVHCERI